MRLALVLGALGVVFWWMQRSVSASAGDPPDGGDTVPHDPQPATSDVTNGMTALAHAIATAEGFGVPGAIPTRAHNPGDLVIPFWTGGSLGAEGISVFASDAEGWSRLYRQLGLIRDGRSRVYTLDMTLTDFAVKWTATEQTIWRDNVVSALQTAGYNVWEESTLRELLA